MGDILPLEDGTLSVVDLTGTWHPLAIPEGVSALAFRMVVSAIHTSYITRNGSFPSFAELVQEYPRLREKDVLTCWESPELQTALRYRGLEWRTEDGLTLAQEHLILALSDPTDRRSQATILRANGVSGVTYRTWLKDKLFAHKLQKLSVEGYVDYMPNIRNALIREAMDGKQQAIELIFAITGEWSPETEALGDLKAVVQSLVESVVKHVTNDAEKQAILADAEAAVRGFRIKNQQALEN
jgi:hypothetical protein